MNNIKILRVEKNLTQLQLGKIVHVAQTAVSQWEQGIKNPEHETAVALADYFGVSLDYLLGRTTERNSSYFASNINGSNFVQGSGSVSVGETDATTKEEFELLRIYRELDVRGRMQLMNAAFALEDESKTPRED